MGQFWWWVYYRNRKEGIARYEPWTPFHFFPFFRWALFDRQKNAGLCRSAKAAPSLSSDNPTFATVFQVGRWVPCFASSNPLPEEEDCRCRMGATNPACGASNLRSI
jgi:hypothetical protein